MVYKGLFVGVTLGYDAEILFRVIAL